MKKLSDELQKSYYILIFVFSFSFLGLLYLFAAYMMHNANSDIVTTNTFINYELKDLKEDLANGESLPQILEEALDESPKIADLFIIFEYNGNSYVNNEKYPKNILVNEENEEIQNIGFYDYKTLHRVINPNETSSIELTIIKDLKNDKKLLFKAMGIAGSWVFITLVIGIFISRKFYNKFIPPLRNIQEITNKINLDSLETETVIEDENNFIEFVSIIRSYGDMLQRLKKQTDAQIDFVNSASHELKTPLSSSYSLI